MSQTRSIELVRPDPEQEWVLASGSNTLRESVKLWDIKGDNLENSLEGNWYDDVYSVAFSPDAKLIAFGASPRVIGIWNDQLGASK